MILIGFGLTKTFEIGVGYIVIGIGLLLIVKAMFLSDIAKIDLQNEKIEFTSFRWFKKHTRIVIKGKISRLLVIDRASEEEPPILVLELLDETTVNFPTGAHRNHYKIWQSLTTLEGHLIDYKEILS